MKVFYSWQSDLNHETHLRFIRSALTEAVARAGTELEFEEAERPEVDEAAKGRRGAENIVSAILNKIAVAAVYVADITPICVNKAGKLMPNPNVLYELGWASAKIGYERVILIMNDAEGYKPKDMPFDICQRPIISYTLKTGSSDIQRDKALSRLTVELAGAVKTDLASHILSYFHEPRRLRARRPAPTISRSGPTKGWSQRKDLTARTRKA